MGYLAQLVVALRSGFHFAPTRKQPVSAALRRSGLLRTLAPARRAKRVHGSENVGTETQTEQYLLSLILEYPIGQRTYVSSDGLTSCLLTSPLCLMSRVWNLATPPKAWELRDLLNPASQASGVETLDFSRKSWLAKCLNLALS